MHFHRITMRRLRSGYHTVTQRKKGFAISQYCMRFITVLHCLLKKNNLFCIEKGYPWLIAKYFFQMLLALFIISSLQGKIFNNTKISCFHSLCWHKEKQCAKIDNRFNKDLRPSVRYVCQLHDINEILFNTKNYHIIDYPNQTID